MKILIKRYYGFTLVELIIVITILTILATVAFVSFNEYTGSSRDSNRVFSIKEISKSLTIQKEITGNFPTPDNIYVTGGINLINSELFNVGLIGNTVTNYIKISKTPKDPVSGSEYLYGLTKNNKYFQIAGTLEKGEILGYKLLSQTYANGGEKALVEGNYKGVLKFQGTDTKNYIGKIPSLIFSKDGTYSLTGVFVLNKDTNLPYNINSNTLGTPKILTSTGVEITSSLKVEDLLATDDWKNIPKEIIEEEITGKILASSSGNGGISQTPTLVCPTGYVLVPGDSTNTFKYSDGSATKDFCVMKYEAKNVSNVAISQTSGIPWTSINQGYAINQCSKLGTGYHLITNNEWMTIARNIEANTQNWANGIKGSLISAGGGLFRGNVNLTDSASCGDALELDGTTSGTNCDVNGRNKRMHILSNGNEIWDLSGNVEEHVNKANTKDGSEYAYLTNSSLCSSNNYWNEWTSCSDKTIGPSGNYNSTNGVGQVYQYAGNIFIRGGHRNIAPNAGVWSLDLSSNSNIANFLIGFRCAYSVN